jgi:putative membrane protein
MNLSLRALILPALIAVAITSSTVFAQQTADADRSFIDKIYQDNLYELEAGKIAAKMADGEDVKDLAWKEVHDHELINRDLSSLAAANKISLASKLSPELQLRIERMKDASGRDFDNAYLAAMLKAHEADEKLLTQETSIGSSELKSFATNTAAIFKRHTAMLHSSDAKD